MTPPWNKSWRIACHHRRVSTDGFGGGSERVNIASAEARGYVGAVRSSCAHSRSLPQGETK